MVYSMVGVSEGGTAIQDRAYVLGVWCHVFIGTSGDLEQGLPGVVTVANSWSALLHEGW